MGPRDTSSEPADPHATCRAALAEKDAAIKAHLEDLAEYEHLAALMRRREEPWIEQWAKATGKHDTLPDYGELLAWIVKRAETAEAQLAEVQRERDALRERVAGLEAALRRHGGHVGPCATFGKLNKHGVYIPRSPGPCDCGYEAALAAPDPTP
jgi:hypothetical protein